VSLTLQHLPGIQNHLAKISIQPSLGAIPGSLKMPKGDMKTGIPDGLISVMKIRASFLLGDTLTSSP